MESSSVIPKILILHSQEQWPLWHSTIKSHAIGGGGEDDVWPYMDPSLVLAPQQPVLPPKPVPRDYMPPDNNTDNATVLQLSAHPNNFAAYREDVRMWEHEIRDEKTKISRIGAVRTLIRTSCSERALLYIVDKNTAFEMLVALKALLAPTNHATELTILRRLNALKTYNKGTAIEGWLDSWESTYNEAKTLNLPAVQGTLICIEFVDAIEPIDPQWSVMMENALLNETVKYDLFELINTYRNRHRTQLAKHPHQKSKNLAFATLNGRDQKGQYRGGNCLCNQQHSYDNCFYLNPSKAPQSWTGFEDIYTKIKETINKSPKLQGLMKAKNITTAHFDTVRKRPQNQPKTGVNESTSNMDRNTDRNADRSADRKAENHAYVTCVEQSSFSTGNYGLYNHWTLDNASNIHVCNDANRWNFKTTSIENNATLTAGKQDYRIEAYGTVEIDVETPKGVKFTMILLDVALVPKFMTNLVSLIRLNRGDVHWSSETPTTLTKYRREYCQLFKNYEHWTFQNNTTYSSYATNSYEPRDQTVTQARMHDLLGHPSKEAIENAEKALNGIKMDNTHDLAPTTIKCTSCSTSKAHRTVSRRSETDNPVLMPFERIHWDYVHMSHSFDSCQYISHIHNQTTQWKDVQCHQNKTQAVDHFITCYNWAKSHYDARIKYVKMDGALLGIRFDMFCQNNGIVTEISSPDTQSQNGAAEVTGKHLMIKGRTLRIASNLPHDMWSELAPTAAYLWNRTPMKRLHWKTPFEALNGRKPLCGHLEIIGSKAYALDHNIPKLQKLQQRALVGFLVGYESTNIYRVWMPSKHQVIRTTDVTFDPNSKYSADDLDIGSISIESAPQIVNQLTLPQLPRNIDHATQEHVNTTDDEVYDYIIVDVPFTPDSDANSSNNDQVTSEDPKEVTENTQLQTPKTTPTPEPQTPPAGPVISSNLAPVTVAPRDINADFSTTNIVEGRRTRKARHAFITQNNRNTLDAYHSSFSAALNAAKPTRIHRDLLPEEPKGWKQMLNHPYALEFKFAAEKEFKTLTSKSTFTYCDVPTPLETPLLPFMWVFKYKFDNNGYLEKMKARLVARGDLQSIQEETYAATLAAQSFRAIMAIAAHFDLEIRQYDAINAFVNASLPEPIYMECPEGYKAPGKCMLVTKALYGLKPSPLHWYNHFTTTLETIGLEPVPGVNCLFKNRWIILLFFVDDIITVYHDSDQFHMDELETSLLRAYEMRVMGEAQQFLSIRILRDRKERKLWLLQDGYIDSLRQKYKISYKTPPKTPLSVVPLAPNTSQATSAQIYGYQQKVGSANFSAVTTRPDIARTCSKLAEHLQNPSEECIKAVDRCLEYLDSTKYYAIEFDGKSISKEHFLGLSDSSYADDLATRYSSNGYIIMLFGGAIHWKATKQHTVTTSSTEAELLALSVAGKEFIWWHRLFHHIRLDLEQDSVLYCDNRQTLRLLNTDTPKLTTKLKHVDVHQMWLRQEVQNHRIKTAWIDTNHMIADGLTKELTTQKHHEFVRMLNLVDIKDRILKEE